MYLTSESCSNKRRLSTTPNSYRPARADLQSNRFMTSKRPGTIQAEYVMAYDDPNRSSKARDEMVNLANGGKKYRI